MDILLHPGSQAVRLLFRIPDLPGRCFRLRQDAAFLRIACGADMGSRLAQFRPSGRTLGGSLLILLHPSELKDDQCQDEDGQERR